MVITMHLMNTAKMSGRSLKLSEVSDKDILSYTEIESGNDLPEDGDIEGGLLL